MNAESIERHSVIKIAQSLLVFFPLLCRKRLRSRVRRAYDEADGATRLHCGRLRHFWEDGELQLNYMPGGYLYGLNSLDGILEALVNQNLR